jgi:hypothetical protein
METTGELAGLKGLKKTIKAVFIKKGEEICKVMEAGHGATAADQNGAINVYRADDGLIRCEAMKFQQIIEQKSYKTAGPAINWANKWLKLIK